ncbi:MAG: glycosyltransferase 87 family protein [Anaerolineales bacterium]|nr:glycosyltransferase 87 family protein [Anaerolineales bacterium]
MKKKQKISLILGLLIFWALSVSVLRWQPGMEIRWVDDPNDKIIYMERAAWIVDGSIPYKDVFSEYPQVPNYLFAVPFIIFSTVQPMATVNSFQYTALFSLFMLGILARTIILLYNLLPNKKNRAFLLLLPASLYFSFNRFDIFPAFLVLLSIALLHRGKGSWASALLGVGTMTKWYPALLFPIFITYEFYRTEKINWRMITVFFGTITLIALPTLITGGWDALKVPYSFHLTRDFEKVSLPAMLHHLVIEPLHLTAFDELLKATFSFLQILPALLTPCLKLDTPKKVTQWSTIVIISFILFSNIYSPQWLLWFMPLLILVNADYPKDILFIAMYNFLIYLTYPIIYDMPAPVYVPMAATQGISIILLTIILNRIYTNLNRKPSPYHAQHILTAIIAKK